MLIGIVTQIHYITLEYLRSSRFKRFLAFVPIFSEDFYNVGGLRLKARNNFNAGSVIRSCQWNTLIY